jgi:hypothetical protein
LHIDRNLPIIWSNRPQVGNPKKTDNNTAVRENTGMGNAKPAKTARQGEKQALHTRSSRFIHRGNQWFFVTREGANIGPYNDKCEAQLALAYFVERTQWPDSRALRHYIETGA